MEPPGMEDLEAVEPVQKSKKENQVIKVLKGGRKVTVEDQMALKVKTISEIVAALIQAHNEGKNVNVTKLKSQLSSKNKLTESPKTVDIIAAIPDAFRKVLIPKLKTKPVRTASGVRFPCRRAPC
jgi:elongator complex protein 3